MNGNIYIYIYIYTDSILYTAASNICKHHMYVIYPVLIPCTHGHISPHISIVLAAYTTVLIHACINPLLLPLLYACM
jgi:hypothetical protein